MNNAITNAVKYLYPAHNLFLTIAILFGLAFAYLTPPLWGTDETSHFARVYQIAHGDIIPQKSKEEFGGKIPENLHSLIGYTIGDLVDNKPTGNISRHDVDNRGAYDTYTEQDFSKNTSSYAQTASYSPVAYIGPVIGTIVGNIVHASIGQTIILARLGSLAVYVALIYFALNALSKYKIKWLVFAVALLPISVFQASVITADNITIGISILFVALLIRSFLAKDTPSVKRKTALALIVCAILLPLIKLNYIFLSFALVLLPATYFKTKRTSLVVKGVSLIAAVILTALWSKISQVTTNAPVSQRPDGKVVDIHAQMLYVLNHPINFGIDFIHSLIKYCDSYIQSATNLIGWNYSSSPMLFIIILGVALVIASLYARSEVVSLRSKLLIISAFSVVGAISIFAVLYLAFTPVGNNLIEGVQGRYFLPFLVPVALMVSSYIPIEIRIKENHAPYIFGMPIVICLIASLGYFALSLY